jgi:hypothetical protein
MELIEQTATTWQQLLKQYPSEIKSFLNFLHQTDAGDAISQQL